MINKQNYINQAHEFSNQASSNEILELSNKFNKQIDSDEDNEELEDKVNEMTINEKWDGFQEEDEDDDGVTLTMKPMALK